MVGCRCATYNPPHRAPRSSRCAARALRYRAGASGAHLPGHRVATHRHRVRATDARPHRRPSKSRRLRADDRRERPHSAFGAAILTSLADGSLLRERTFPDFGNIVLQRPLALWAQREAAIVTAPRPRPARSAPAELLLARDPRARRPAELLLARDPRARRRRSYCLPATRALGAGGAIPCPRPAARSRRRSGRSGPGRRRRASPPDRGTARWSWPARSGDSRC